MPTTRKSLLFLFAVVVFFAGCRKETSEQPQTGGGPLAYSLPVPDWLLDSTGHMVEYPADNPSTTHGVALGRRLFYEKALSDDQTISCGSCHKQENGFSDPRQFSIGTDGSVGTRQAMGIMDLAWDELFFWDGRAASLELQAYGPVTNMIEMRNTWPVVEARLQAHPEYPALFEQAFGSPGIDSVRVAFAIAQFERSLISFNSPFDRFRYEGDSTAMSESEQRGMTLFMRGAHCVDCHREPMMADHGMRNNGLDLVYTDLGLGGITGNPAQNGRFKVPTLRNIAVTAPYMHDGRFATLEEVVDFYADDVHVESPNLDNHMLPWSAGQVVLSPEDRADLVAFLRALTDTEFLTDPAFADPH